MIRLIPLIAAALSGFLSAPAFAQDWTEYSNQKDFFSITIPGQPTVREITYQTEYAITLPARVYTYESGGNRYSVTVVDYTDVERKHADLVKSCKAAGGDGDSCNDRTNGDVRGAILYATWNLIHKAAKVTHLAYTNADRVEGNELYLTNTDGSRTFASIFMHENRLYIVDGTVPVNSPPPMLFQQSMGFLDKEGKRIRYNATYSNGFPAPSRAR
jgi:hypothetical protein